MRDVTNAKGLSDLRTATTRHIASKPRRQGTTHLDIYSLSMEKQRLEKELSNLEQRHKRVHDRLAEVQRAIERLEDTAQREKMADSSLAKPIAAVQAEAREQSGGRQWKKMTVNY